MSRTVINLVPSADPWPIIDSWASAHGYAVDGHGAWGRSYKRGDGFWTAISRVQIDATPTGLQLSAWVPFWGSGTELDVHHLNPLQYFPRRKAQKQFNALLRGLGAPEI